MCGLSIDLMFRVAIGIVVVCVIFGMLAWAFPGLFVKFNFAGPFGGLLRILVGGVIALILIVLIWKMAECAGLMRGALLGDETQALMGDTDGSPPSCAALDSSGIVIERPHPCISSVKFMFH